VWRAAAKLIRYAKHVFLPRVDERTVLVDLRGSTGHRLLVLKLDRIDRVGARACGAQVSSNLLYNLEKPVLNLFQFRPLHFNFAAFLLQLSF